MPYSKTTWVNGEVPAINATNLNKIETGIETAQTTAETAQTTADAAATLAAVEDSFGFKTVDSSGGGDYLTIEEAYTDGEFRLFLAKGEHIVDSALPTCPPNSTVHLKGAGKGNTTIKYVNGNGSTRYLAKPRDLVPEDLASEWPASGTYTISNGNQLNLTGLTYRNGNTSLAEGGWGIGTCIILGGHAGVGAAQITAFTEGAGTATILVDRINRQILDDSNFGDASYLWSFNNIAFSLHDVKIEGDGISATQCCKAADDGNSSFRTHIHDIITTDNFYIGSEIGDVWSIYMANVNVNTFDALGSMGRIDNCSFGQLWGGKNSYIGDVLLTNCQINGVSEASGSHWDNVYCRFISCDFSFDITSKTYFGKSEATHAKLHQCWDVNGLYTQPA